MEIERKFLVPVLPDLSGAEPLAVRQGYLTQRDDSIEMRLRQKGETFLLTFKSGSGLEREEREAEIGRSQFEIFWPATEGRRVEKIRWTGGLANGLVFELDVFEGALAPLMMVEVEFDSRTSAESFVPPGWFGEDVTEDRAYSNRVMALDGVPGRSEAK